MLMRKQEKQKELQVLANSLRDEISEYSNTNYHEFFAETFAMRESGQKLPDYVENMLKEVCGK